MNPPIRIPNISLPGSYASSGSASTLAWQTESNALNALGEAGIQWVYYEPPSNPPTELSPGRYTAFSAQPPPWPTWEGGGSVALLRERVPRHMVWFVTDSLELPDDALGALVESTYTHVILASLQLGPSDPSNARSPLALTSADGRKADVATASLPRLQGLRVGPRAKRVMVSVGGPGSGTWAAIAGREAEAASLLAACLNQNQLDGVDLNFEGGSGASAADPSLPGTVGRLLGELRRVLPDAFLTLTPTADTLQAQLKAICDANPGIPSPFNLLSWIHHPFDPARGAGLDAQNALIPQFDALVGSGIPASRLVVAVTLDSSGDSSADTAANFAKLLGLVAPVDPGAESASPLRQLVQEHPDFGGVLVRTFQATQGAAAIGWDGQILDGLKSAYSSPDAAPPVPPPAVPRNLIWVGSDALPPSLDWAPLGSLLSTVYTHIILCFLHFRHLPGSGLSLVINGPYPVENYAAFWSLVTSLKGGNWPKKVMISIGGWGSGTWQAIYGREAEAARILSAFVVQHGFDGLDVNFEGSWDEGPFPFPAPDFPGTNPGDVRRNDPRWLATLARFLVALRDGLGDLELSVAPIADTVLGPSGQLTAITREAVPSGRTWKDIISWVNAQFYLYPGMMNVPATYDNLVKDLGLPTDRLAIGFCLNGEGGVAGLNSDALRALEADNVAATRSAVAEIVKLQVKSAPFGAFVWNYRAAVHPPNLGWDTQIGAALNGTPAPAPANATPAG